MDLSVTIVGFNTRERLRQCLQSIFSSDTKYQFEVWVVDNASGDGSVEMVRREFPQVHLLENKENLGFARANNQAITELLRTNQGSTSLSASPLGNPLKIASRFLGNPDLARGEGDLPKHFLLLNPDVEVAPDTFDKMISFMNNNPKVGISGCKVTKPEGKLDLACRRSFPDPVNAFFRVTGLSFLFPKSRLASYNLTYLPEDEIAEVDSVMGAFLLIRREVVERIGLLDEDFYMYGEDLDWCFRAKQAGYKVMYVPLTTVIHHKGSSSRQMPARALYEFHHAMQLFYNKHYRERYNFLLNWLVILGIWLRFIVLVIFKSFRREKYVSK